MTIYVCMHTLKSRREPKTSHSLVRIFVQRYNWVIFLRKWARGSRYRQWRSLSGHVERIFVHKNWRGGYIWQHLVSTGRRYMPHSGSYTQCFGPCFWRSHYQPQSWCRLATLEQRFDCYLWGAVKDKCYADKTETIFVKYSCTQSIMCLKFGLIG